jgi:hypothetical protein
MPFQPHAAGKMRKRGRREVELQLGFLRLHTNTLERSGRNMFRNLRCDFQPGREKVTTANAGL